MTGSTLGSAAAVGAAAVWESGTIGSTLGSGAGAAGVGGVGGGTTTSAVGVLVGGGASVMVANMLASCWRAARWTSAAGGRGAASEGRRSAAIRSVAAAVASSRDEVVGISTWEGNQVRVLVIMRSAEVASVQTV